jgi:thymidylate synthase
MNVEFIRNTFLDLYDHFKDQPTIEIIGASFLADEDSIFGTPNNEYIESEIEWYNSCSTNIQDLLYYPMPIAWEKTANHHGEVNSNYGKLIFADKYYNQYNNVKEELKNNPDSRRAVMIYTRPSIWNEYKEDGKNDFICTNAVSYNRTGKFINAVVQMRSNDAVYGYKNDFAWQKYVLEKLCKDLDYQVGQIYWQVQNLHIYEKHYKFLER